MTVIVAGSINMDVVAFTERHPLPGETLDARVLKFIPGGKGANQAVASARLGAPTKLIGRIGEDSFGEAIEHFLLAEGIDISLLTRTAEAPTGTALIVVAESSENTIVVVSGANGLLGSEDVESVEIGRDSVLVSQFEIPQATVESFFRRGKQVSALTILNLAPAKFCSRDLLELTDILVVNETELGLLLTSQASGASSTLNLAPEEVVAVARKVLLPAQKAVVVTLGESGAVACTADGTIIVPGYKVRAVDTTGAGDCFVGALAARLAAGETLKAAMAFANLAASVCVQRVGAGTSMPSLDEVAGRGAL